MYYASEFRGGVYSIYPYRTVEVFEWLMGDEFRVEVERVRNAKNKDEMDVLKKSLPGITVSGVFTVRNKAGLSEPNGLILLDIDGKQNLHHTDMEKLKHLVFELPYVRLAMLSCSSGGVLAVVELADYRNHYLHFLALQEDLAAINVNIDASCKDISRFRFATNDQAPLYRDKAEIYTKLSDVATPIDTVVVRPKSNNSKPSAAVRPNKKWTPRPLTQQEMIEKLLKPHIGEKWSTLTVPKHYTPQQATIYLILAKIANTDFDVTEVYDDWRRIAALLARYFGEGEGRELFHDVSRHYKRYKPAECDRLYNSFLIKPNTQFSINQIQEMARHYGF